MKKAKDIMNIDIVSFSPDTSIFVAAEEFAKRKISGAPVVDKKGKIIGVISASDIIRFVDIKMSKLPMIYSPGISCLLLMFIQIEKGHIDFKSEMKKVSRTKVKDVMTRHIITITPNASLLEISELIEKEDVNRLPVVNKTGKIVGIVARADVIRGIIS